MVAEDNADVRQTLSQLLEMDGHKVSSVSDGQEEVAAALECLPDVVLLYLGMPVMDGFAAAQFLRSDSRFRATYIAAITGYSDAVTCQRCVSAGFNALFVKPLGTGQLLDALCSQRDVRTHKSSTRVVAS